jgi:transposase-like protein
LKSSPTVVAAGIGLQRISCGLWRKRLDDRASVSVVARRHGVAPNLLYRWRRLMLEGGSVAVADDGEVTGNKTVRQMEERIRELERQLGRKTLAVEILKEALYKSRSKKQILLSRLFAEGRYAMKTIAETLGVARSNL